MDQNGLTPMMPPVDSDIWLIIVPENGRASPGVRVGSSHGITDRPGLSPGTIH